MIGQNKLFDRVNRYNINTFPRANLIIGEKGCGKHSFVVYLCDRLEVNYVDISSNVSNEFLLDLYKDTQLAVYVIDINELASKSRYINKENALLKFIEEPPTNSFIFILAEYETQVIDTIKNRCVIWKFSPYTIDELKIFKVFNDIKIYTALNTPGKLLDSKPEEFYLELFDLCNTIIHKIKQANVSNTLSLDRHLEKYDINLFLRVLKIILYNECCVNYSQELFIAYDLVNRYIEKSHTLNISKKQLFDNFLLDLKTIND